MILGFTLWQSHNHTDRDILFSACQTAKYHVWIWKPLTNNLQSHPFFPINNSAQFRECGRYLHKILISMDPLGYFTRVLLYLYL